MPKNFAEYIADATLKVRHARSLYYQGDKLEQVIRMSSPFELLPKTDAEGAHAKYKKGILLTHGFLNTPYFMKSLADDFAKQGYLVRVILLPGHGTDYRDLDSVTWQDWLATVRFGYETLVADCDEVYLAGFSIGATLSLMLTLEMFAKDHASALKKLILLAPCFGISPLTKMFPFLIKTHLSKILPKLFCTQSEKEHLASYKEFSLYSVSQIVMMLRQLKEALLPYQEQRIPLPTFVVASQEDATVKFAPIENFVQNYLNASSFFYVYNNKRLKVSLSVPTYQVSIQTLQPNVLAMSHVGIPVASTDAYFGSEGTYYGKLAEDMCFGEPKHFHRSIKRLMYNPDYLNLKKYLFNWI